MTTSMPNPNASAGPGRVEAVQERRDQFGKIIREQTGCGLSVDAESAFCNDPRLPDDLRAETCGCLAAGWQIAAEALSTAPDRAPVEAGGGVVRPKGRVRIEHDGFIGYVIGYYTTHEGKRGVVLQQDGTRVVHVYGEKWIPVSTRCAICGGEHDNDLGSDICQSCEETAPWRDATPPPAPLTPSGASVEAVADTGQGRSRT